MQPPLPSATPTWHNDTYPAISPSRPELSVAGKMIVMTGAVSSFSVAPRPTNQKNTLTNPLIGKRIGRETALAFANARAKQLVLLGRNEVTLKETEDQIPQNTASCSIHAVSVTDEAGLKTVAVVVGTWDVLVLNAGFISKPASAAESSMDEWW